MTSHPSQMMIIMYCNFQHFTPLTFIGILNTVHPRVTFIKYYYRHVLPFHWLLYCLIKRWASLQDDVVLIMISKHASNTESKSNQNIPMGHSNKYSMPSKDRLKKCQMAPYIQKFFNLFMSCYQLLLFPTLKIFTVTL